MNQKKVALVTAASRGIGAGIARHLAADGYSTVIFARSDAIHTVAQTIGATAVQGDITRPEDLERLVNETMQLHGRIDAVIVSTGDPPTQTPILEISDAQWQHHFELLYLNVVRLARLITPIMVRQQSGAWVNITAADRLEPSAFSPYSILRVPLLSFSKLYAREYGRHGIRMNVLAPGNTWDDVAQAGDYAAYDKAQYPLGRVARYEELARAAAFLISDEAAYISGIELKHEGASTRSL